MLILFTVRFGALLRFWAADKTRAASGGNRSEEARNLECCFLLAETAMQQRAQKELQMMFSNLLIIFTLFFGLGHTRSLPLDPSGRFFFFWVFGTYAMGAKQRIVGTLSTISWRTVAALFVPAFCFVLLFGSIVSPHSAAKRESVQLTSVSTLAANVTRRRAPVVPVVTSSGVLFTGITCNVSGLFGNQLLGVLGCMALARHWQLDVLTEPALWDPQPFAPQNFQALALGAYHSFSVFWPNFACATTDLAGTRVLPRVPYQPTHEYVFKFYTQPQTGWWDLSIAGFARQVEHKARASNVFEYQGSRVLAVGPWFASWNPAVARVDLPLFSAAARALASANPRFCDHVESLLAKWAGDKVVVIHTHGDSKIYNSVFPVEKTEWLVKRLVGDSRVRFVLFGDGDFSRYDLPQLFKPHSFTLLVDNRLNSTMLPMAMNFLLAVNPRVSFVSLNTKSSFDSFVRYARWTKLGAENQTCFTSGSQRFDFLGKPNPLCEQSGLKLVPATVSVSSCSFFGGFDPFA